MHIYNHTVYSLNGNIGEEYNKYMDLIPDEDWACFLDHDAVFTTPDWYVQLHNIIKKNPQYGLYTCMMNRVGTKYQIHKGIDPNNHDMKYHRMIGNSRLKQYKNQVVDITHNSPLSGVVILVSKNVWKRIGGCKDGFLGVDNDIHIRCRNNNILVGLMEGIYVYHWYRADKKDGRPYLNAK